MMKRIFKIFGIVLLIIGLIAGILIFFLFSQYKKLEKGELTNTFITDTIPFTYSNSGHILINVKINDSKKTYPFILDSGASNFIFHHKEDKFNLENNGRAIGIGSLGDIFPTKIKKISSLQIGNSIFKNLNAKEIEYKFVCSNNIYGLIGTGVMHHLVWQIDFKSKLIFISKKLENLSFNSNKIEIPLSENRFSHHLKVSFKIGNLEEPIKALIDLGNNITLSLKESDLREKATTLPSKKIIGQASRGLTDEKLESKEKFYLLDSLLFNKSSYKIEKLPILTSPKGINLLGLGFFKKYKTTISWPDHKLILEPYDSIQNFIWKTHGYSLNFDSRQEKTIISAIVEKTSAFKKNLPLNGQIMSINGNSLNNKKNYCEYKISDSDEDDTLRLKIKTNGNVKSYFIIKKPLFN